MAGINLVDGYSLTVKGDNYDINDIINLPDFIAFENKVKNKNYTLNYDYQYIPSDEMYGEENSVVTFFIGIDIHTSNTIDEGEVITLDFPKNSYGDYKNEEDDMIELRKILESHFDKKIITKRGLILNNWG